MYYTRMNGNLAPGIRIMSLDLNPPPFYSTVFDLHPEFDVELILKFNNLEIHSCFRPCFYCRGIISTDTSLSSFDISMWMFLFNPWLQQIKLHKYYSYIYRGCVWQVRNYRQVNLHHEIFLLKCGCALRFFVPQTSQAHNLIYC